MYEQFRNEVMAKLNGMDDATIRKLLASMDMVADHYTIKRAETGLIVYQRGLPDVCKAYLVSRSIEGLSAGTINLYKTTLTKFFTMMDKPIDSLSVNDIRVWLYNYENMRNVSKQTMELYREIINGFFEWAANEGWLSKNPVATIKPIKYTRKPRKAMGQIDLEYIRSACKTEKELAIVEILYSTGCRVSELSVLKLSDINWEKKEVLLFGKGGKYRTSYLNAKAIVALKKYLKTREDDCEFVIVTDRAPYTNIQKSGFEKIVRKIASRVNDKLSVHVTPHVFRHTTATAAMQHGMPVQDVQRILGHKSINTTMIYAEVSQSEVKNMHIRCVV